MRNIFETIEDLAEHVKTHPRSKQTPFVVKLSGVTRYVLSNNADGAVAGVARQTLAAHVEPVSITELLLSKLLED